MELRSYVITELRTDQIQYSPTFSKWAIKKSKGAQNKTRRAKLQEVRAFPVYSYGTILNPHKLCVL